VAKKKVKGTKKQHAELDAEYKAKLLPKNNLMAFWLNLNVMRMWKQEKDYLSRHGQRYGKIVNIGY
jgi:hypothetical protein